MSESEFDNLGDDGKTGNGKPINHETAPVVLSDAERQQIIDQWLADQKAKASVAPAAGAAADAPQTPAQGLPALTRIIMEEGDHIPPGGQPIGHNGTVYLLKPGVEQDVPEALLNILDDAVIEKPIVSNDGFKIIGQRKMLRFPYRVVRQQP